MDAKALLGGPEKQQVFGQKQLAQYAVVASFAPLFLPGIRTANF